MSPASSQENASKKVRLNKRIADSGLCSRRKADLLIQGGHVQVNRQIVMAPGRQVDPEQDDIQVEGHPLPAKTFCYLLLHKPVGVLTTRSDEKGRKTIYAFLPEDLSMVDPAGRLDRESSGALILSNDGDFLYRITHPKFHLEKVYRVGIDKPMAGKDQQQLCAGVRLMPENKIAKVERIIVETPMVLELTLLTGYNRQIRRSLEALGYRVLKLKRVKIGPILLGGLKPGAFRHLTTAERQQLLNC